MSKFLSYRVSKFPSFQVSKGRRKAGRTNERPGTDHVTSGPIRGLGKKLHLMAHTDKQTNGHGDFMTNSAQWGQVGENLVVKFRNIETYVYFHQIGPLGRFGLVVAMSVHMFVCWCVCPLSCDFFKVLKSKEFRHLMWLCIKINIKRREKPPLSIIIYILTILFNVNLN